MNDLDGRVHTNPDYFDGALGSGASAKGLVTELVDGLDLSAQQEQALEGKDECEYMSPTELKPRCDLSWVQMYDVLALFTPYPVGNPAVPPAVNVNTARRQTIRAALTQVPSLENQDLEIDELVDRMAQQRPFGKRKALESVVYNHFKPKFDAAPNEGERKKVEKRFNDVLNSLNGTEASDYRLPGDTTGVYQYDLENSQFTGGEHTSDADVTWGCEFKFSSRFYRVVVLGRGWRKGSGRSRTVRRWLEAVYDAAGDKIIWQRVHLTPDFNIITN